MWDFTAQHTFVPVQQRWFNNTGGSRVVKHGPRINPQNFTCSCNRHTHEPRPRDSRRSASVAKPHTVLYVSRLICRRCCGSEVAKLVLTIHDHIDGCQDAGYTHKHVLSLRGGAPHSPLCSAAWQARVTYYEAQAAICCQADPKPCQQVIPELGHLLGAHLQKLTAGVRARKSTLKLKNAAWPARAAQLPQRL